MNHELFKKLEREEDCPLTLNESLSASTAFLMGMKDVGKAVIEGVTSFDGNALSIAAFHIFFPMFLITFGTALILAVTKIIGWGGFVMLIILGIVLFWSLAISFRESLRVYFQFKKNNMESGIISLFQENLPKAFLKASEAYLEARKTSRAPCNILPTNPERLNRVK